MGVPPIHFDRIFHINYPFWGSHDFGKPSKRGCILEMPKIDGCKSFGIFPSRWDEGMNQLNFSLVGLQN